MDKPHLTQNVAYLNPHYCMYTYIQAQNTVLNSSLIGRQAHMEI